MVARLHVHRHVRECGYASARVRRRYAETIDDDDDDDDDGGGGGGGNVGGDAQRD